MPEHEVNSGETFLAMMGEKLECLSESSVEASAWNRLVVSALPGFVN